MAWSNTRATEWRKRPSCRSSCANALTTRTPEMFSSASAVSSAMRCCTSWSAGRDRPDRQPVTVVVADCVDRTARQVRDQYRRHHRAKGEHERPCDAPLVGLQEAEQSLEDEHTS